MLFLRRSLTRLPALRRALSSASPPAAAATPLPSRVCSGCGVAMQTADHTAPGFVPARQPKRKRIVLHDKEGSASTVIPLTLDQQLKLLHAENMDTPEDAKSFLGDDLLLQSLLFDSKDYVDELPRDQQGAKQRPIRADDTDDALAVGVDELTRGEELAFAFSDQTLPGEATAIDVKEALTGYDEALSQHEQSIEDRQDHLQRRLKKAQAEAQPSPRPSQPSDSRTPENSTLASSEEELPEELSHFDSPEDEMVVCQRCYRMRHQGDEGPVHVTAPEIGLSELHDTLKRAIESPTKRKHAVVLHVVDLADFPLSYIRDLDKQIPEDLPTIIVVNKGDIIGTKHAEDPTGRIRAWVRQTGLEAGITDIEDYAMRVVCSRNGAGITSLIRFIRKLRRHPRQSVIVVGRTNVGKSSLVNRLLPSFRGRGRRPRATTCHLPGTTLGNVAFTIGEETSIEPAVSSDASLSDVPVMLDTPGATCASGVLPFLTPREGAQLVANKPLTPITFSMKPGRTMFLGSIARIDFLHGADHASFTVYASSHVRVHVTNTNKADRVYAKHAGTPMLSPPHGGPDRLAALPKMSSPTPYLDIKTIGPRESSRDIVFGGLGWVAVAGPRDCTLRVCAQQLSGRDICTRPALAPFAVRYQGPRIRSGDRARHFGSAKGENLF